MGIQNRGGLSKYYTGKLNFGDFFAIACHDRFPIKI
jgi:hypothetical protein